MKSVRSQKALHEEGGHGVKWQASSQKSKDLDNPPLSEHMLHEAEWTFPGQGAHLKQIRAALGLTQREFAELFAVSLRTLQEWEQGRRRMSKATRHFLRLIEHAPEVVKQVLLTK